MLGTLDVRAVQENSTDIAVLRAYLQQLVGEPFLQARFSYGDELTLHFGEARRPQSKMLAHTTRGSYIVGARASSWCLKAVSGPMLFVAMSDSRATAPEGFKPLSAEQVEANQLLKPGTPIVAADVELRKSGEAAAFTCSLVMSDGSSLLIVPETESPANAKEAVDGIADWEVFTPHDRYLRVGPGAAWSYLPSRVSKQS